MAPIHALGDELVAALLGFATPRELEAFACASKFVARAVLPRFPVWRALFLARWEAVNFVLPGARDDRVPLVLTPQLRALFGPDCSESRVFQILTHAITAVPAYADIDVTRFYRGSSADAQEIVSLHDPKVDASRVVRFAYDGEVLGDDRCVRSNVPFPAKFHVAVFKRKNQQTGRLEYQVGAVASGYFEVSIVKRLNPSAIRLHGLDVTSIGVVTGRFPLVDRQPGWDFRSYGYHGDDGHAFHSNRGQEFGPAFGTNDTVGCCVRRSIKDERSFVTFTHNGSRINRLQEEFECIHDEWYPAVGIDSSNAIHINFGQEPFADDSIVDELFSECENMPEAALKQLEWQLIFDFDDDEYYSDDQLAEEESESEASLPSSDIYSDVYDEYGLFDYDSDEAMFSPVHSGD